MPELQIDVLPKATARGLAHFTQFSPLDGSKWYLAGGTALALQAGHRKSVDLDFFHPSPDPDLASLEIDLRATDKWETTNTSRGTLYGLFDTAKASFIAYPFFNPAQAFIKHGFINILDARDIAVMKVIAISQRGRMRDFIDLYWYVKNRESLEDVMRRVDIQYPKQKHNYPHFFKSLTYFVDADEEKMPELYFDTTWSEIKSFFQKEVPALSRRLLLS